MQEWQCVTNIHTELLSILIKSNSSVPLFFTSTVKTLFTPAYINLSTDDSQRTRTSESTVRMAMFSKPLTASYIACRINLRAPSSAVQ